MPLDEAAQKILDRLIDERRTEAQTYLPGTHDFPIGRAEGSYVFDEIGKPYLDFGPGGAVNILGHRNPRLMQVISEHLRFYTYTGTDHLSRFSVEYAKALSAHFPEPKQVLVVPDLVRARDNARMMERESSRPVRICTEKTGGFGRTGRMWSYQRDMEDPDIVVLGPAGGGGLPFAAVVASPELFKAVSPSLMANHPVVCAAAMAVLEQITPELLAHVTKMGEVLSEGIAGLASQFPIVGTISGVGLLQRLSLTEQEQTQRFYESCRAKGLLLHPDLGMTPPLIITEQEVRAAIDIIADVCLDL